MSVPKRTDKKWKKSSYSGGSGQCVEVALDESIIGVRDSKAPMSGELDLPAAAWVALLEKIKNG